ncbi:hypothetical protein EG68_02817 [Paragonimus skrjabini miyazakii]|uniref:Protein NDRG3 n=1 Tax=Paragonimus skrjabini miyazakii TaxID=59628 RepID=A0A8S9Z7L9_9TREM|nr:hypothetical protein EG68_02817 [Paragonimus skrjabini miyazakii]
MEIPLVSFQDGDTNIISHRGSHPGPNLSPNGTSFHKEDFDTCSVLSRNVSQLEEHEILTSSGISQRVYVQPSKNKTALVTYHDIGTNHTSFLGFFNHPEMLVIAKHFTVYHICAPGHHENAPNVVFDIPSRIVRRLMSDTSVGMQQDQSLLTETKENQDQDKPSVLTSSGSLSIDGRRGSAMEHRLQYPNLDQLAQMLTSVLVHFGIEYFLGFGMGAGSNILARYALHNPDNVLGLFLLNPTATTHTYFQRFRCRWWDLPYLQQGYLTDNLLEQLDAHWFGYGKAENEDVVQFYHQLARSLNPFNLAGYIQAFMERTALPLVRPIGPSMPDATPSVDHESEPTVIRTDVCLVTGDQSPDLCRVLAEMNGHMDPRRTQFLTIPDCTGMVMEENPDKLAVDFLHFLRTIGLLISLTPEKLHQQAIALQVAQHQSNGLSSSVVGSTLAQLDVGNEL